MLINTKTLIISISYFLDSFHHPSGFCCGRKRKWQIKIINCFIFHLICKQPTRICLSFLSRTYFVRADNIDKFARPDTQRHQASRDGSTYLMCQHPQIWSSHDICLPSSGKCVTSMLSVVCHGQKIYLTLTIIPVCDRIRYGQTQCLFMCLSESLIETLQV